MKTCSKCKTVKPYELFPVRRLGPKAAKDGRDSWCRECHRVRGIERRKDPVTRARCIAASRRWQANNRERFARSQRNKDLQNLYGITLEEFHRRVERQGGLCAVCGKPEDKSKRSTRFYVDHCHETNEVRGIVHNLCNLMLGHSGDNPATLMAGAQYLLRHKKLKLVS